MNCKASLLTSEAEFDPLLSLLSKIFVSVWLIISSSFSEF